MDHNLALLPPDEKQRIELEKQAAYVVWQIKHSFTNQAALSDQIAAIGDEAQRVHFIACVNKYASKMKMEPLLAQ